MKVEMTAMDWMWELNQACCGFPSNEKPKQKASNSEIRRWFEKSSIIINGNKVKALDLIDHIETIVLFPKSERQRRSFEF